MSSADGTISLSPAENAIPQIKLPTVSYGPFKLLEAMPWLMFASAMRFLAYRGGVFWIVCNVLSEFAVFLAFLLAARRMIEFTGGTTPKLARLGFKEQISLAGKVLGRVIVLLIAACLAVSLLLGPYTGLSMLLGFDGIAFDQFSGAGRIWSSILTAIVLLMVVQAENAPVFTLGSTLKELRQRILCMGAAIVVVALFQFGFSWVQGMARGVVYLFWKTSPLPQGVKDLAYFFFVFGFATLRLWATLAILVFALRESYRRGDVPTP